MKTKPKVFLFTSVFLLTVAIGLPLQIMWLYGYRPWEVVNVALMLAPLNWLVLGGAMVTAVLAYQASPAVLIAAPLLASLVAYNNWFVAEASFDYSAVSTLAASVLFMAGLSGLLTKEARRVLINPNLRWWMTPQRIKTHVPIYLRWQSQQYNHYDQEWNATTYDLSSGGAFIDSPAALKALPVGSRFAIALNLDPHHAINCQAEVVRNVSQTQGAYPAGVGVRFLGLDHNQKKTLEDYVKHAHPTEPPALSQAA